MERWSDGSGQASLSGQAAKKLCCLQENLTEMT